jgi:small subunit ribosomal protein S1
VKNDDSWDDEDSEKEKVQKRSEFAQMLEDSFKSKSKRLSVGDKVRGEVLLVGKEEVFVSTGTMTDGVVSRRDLVDESGKVPYKVGDSLDLFVTQIRGSEIFLSPKPTSKNLADDLEDAFDMMMPIEGRVAEVCKGGFRVAFGAKLAFCPISQMDSKRIDTPEDYVGKKFEFRITQFSERGRNIVVSRRKLLEEERGLTQESFLSEHKAGDVVRGTIRRLEKFGVFVEVAPGVEGLAHISELSWSRVNDPQEVTSVGQEVSVKILKIEKQEDQTRISLSIKQAGEQPWDNMPSQVREGQVVEGKVTRCMKFGAFVELIPGVEGLIPLSEMSYTKRVVRSDELFKEGEKILVKVKEIESGTRRILLSLKDAGADPWALASQKFPVGTILKGVVERREPYGLFVRLEEGVTGLLPKSKAMDRPEFAFDRIKIGEEVTVQIGELRLEERRISLDVPKDPGSDDWKSYSPQNTGSFGNLGDQLKKALEKKTKK